MKPYFSPQAELIKLLRADVLTTSKGFDIGMDVPAVEDEEWQIGGKGS